MTTDIMQNIETIHRINGLHRNKVHLNELNDHFHWSWPPYIGHDRIDSVMTYLNDAMLRYNENERICSKARDHIAHPWKKILQNQSTKLTISKQMLAQLRNSWKGKKIRRRPLSAHSYVMRKLLRPMKTNESNRYIQVFSWWITRIKKGEMLLCMLIQSIMAHTNTQGANYIWKYRWLCNRSSAQYSKINAPCNVRGTLQTRWSTPRILHTRSSTHCKLCSRLTRNASCTTDHIYPHITEKVVRRFSTEWAT